MNKNTTVSLAAVSMFAALTAVGAFIKIPLPHVPFTLQVLFVFLSGSLLGWKRGLQSQLVYVCIGLVGFPVFTQGGGISYIFQPTFGYLIGFIAGAFVIGWIIDKIDQPKTYHFILAHFAGLLVVYAIGVPYLFMALNMWMGIPSSWSHVIMIGFVYSIAGDILISIVAGVLAARLYKVFQSVRSKNKIENQKESIV
ncbi:biotin transporter BioY [Niallia sp. 01092]|uniref:biotin transporter BioY n=1 Tax=unclassified Niallia TaxID=2837522 RepID=UPI003FD4D5A3